MSVSATSLTIATEVLSITPGSLALAAELKLHVRTHLGADAVPDELEFVPNLPRTPSGKIMRRLMRAREFGEPVGDISTMDG